MNVLQAIESSANVTGKRAIRLSKIGDWGPGGMAALPACKWQTLPYGPSSPRQSPSSMTPERSASMLVVSTHIAVRTLRLDSATAFLHFTIGRIKPDQKII